MLDQAPPFIAEGLGTGYLAKSSAYTVTKADSGSLIDCTGTFDLTLPTAASAGAGWSFLVRNASTGVITINPNGSETVNGALTAKLDTARGIWAVFCDGSNFIAKVWSGAFADVRDFGATADGTTNDATAIQAAVDAAITLGGGIVYLPPGQYRTTSTLNIRGTNCLTFCGAAMGDPRISSGYEPGSAILTSANPAISLDNTGAGTSRTNNILIRDLLIKRFAEDTTGVGIEIPTHAQFHGNIRIVNVGCFYFATGFYARFCGWIYLDKSTFQLNTVGIDVQANIFDAQDCLFYQNGSFSGTVNDMRFATTSVAGAGVRISGNAISFTSCDFENNGVGILAYSDGSLSSRTTISIVAGYFENHSKQCAAVYDCALTMDACYSNNAANDRFYFDSSRVLIRACNKFTVVENQCEFVADGCYTLAQTDIIDTTPADISVSMTGGLMNRRGTPSDIFIEPIKYEGYTRLPISELAFTTSNVTQTLNTSTTDNPFERNSRSLQATANGGYGRIALLSAISTSEYFSISVAVKTTAGTVGLRLVDASGSTTKLELGSTILQVDGNNVSTLQLWGKGISTTGNLELWIFPGSVSAGNGTTCTVMALAAWKSVNRYSGFVGFGSPAEWYGTGAPAAGYHEVGERVYIVTPVAGGNSSWICTTAGTPGTWTTFGAGPFLDSQFSVVGSGDTTKSVRFEVDSQSAGAQLTLDTGAQSTGRTLSVPVLSGSDTIDVLGLAQTMTAKKTFNAGIGMASATTIDILSQPILGGTTATLQHYCGSTAWALYNNSGGTQHIAVGNATGNVVLTNTTEASAIGTAGLVADGGASFAKNLIAGQGLGLGVTSTATAAGTTTLTSSSDAVQIFTGTTTQDVNLPAANSFSSNCAVVFIIKNLSTGNVTINRAGSDTIDGGTSVVLTGGSNSSVTLMSNGSNAWVQV